MSLATRIKASSLDVDGVKRNDLNGIAVATFPAMPEEFTTDRLKDTETQTTDLAISGQSTTQVVIWNSSQDAGGDWVQSESGNETTASAHTGLAGFDSGVRNAGSKTRFTTGTPYDASQNDRLTLWINYQLFDGTSDLKIEFRNAGNHVGNSVLAKSYLVNFTLNTWVQLVIPISDFNLTGLVDQLRLEYRNGNQQLYIDDMEFSDIAQSTGTGIYRIASDFGKVLKIYEARLSIVAATSGWNYNEFTTLTKLSAGLLVRWVTEGGKIKWSKNILDNTDLFGLFDIETNVDFLDANRLIVLALDMRDASIELFSGDVFEIHVRDDLSSLLKVETWVVGATRNMKTPRGLDEYR